MSRYRIIVDEKKEEEQIHLRQERNKEENNRIFDDVKKMSDFMSLLNSVWVPTHFGFIMKYREFEGVITVIISTAEYNKTKDLLPKELLIQFEAHGVVVFKKS